MARRKRKKQEDSGGGGNWLTTFSDLMSLLLTFFILLHSMSSVGEDEVGEASGALQQGFMGEGASIFDGDRLPDMDSGAVETNGIGDGEEPNAAEILEPDYSTEIVENFDPNEGVGEDSGEYVEEGTEVVESYETEYSGETTTGGETETIEHTEPVVVSSSQSDIPEAVKLVHQRAQTIIQNNGYGNQMNVYSDPRGVYLYVHESILFNTGESTITATGRQTLSSITELLKGSNDDILIEGFTDDLPLENSTYPTNWELSAGRAMAVVRYYAENQGINPTRLSGRGYGEYNPIVPNNSDANRSMNRRVNIVLVYHGEEN